MLDERQARQVRAWYGAKLTMIDHWFGRVLDALDRDGLWDDTAVIVCTDHGHYLGEKDIWGKPRGADLRAAGPHPAAGRLARRRRRATCDALDHQRRPARHAGRPVRRRRPAPHARPLARAACCAARPTSVRDWVLAGVWGREVHVVDRERRSTPRAPAGDNAPLSMWSNRWSTMPVHVLDPSSRLPLPDDRAVLDRMPGSTVPVIRQPFGAGDRLPFWAWSASAATTSGIGSRIPAETRDLVADAVPAPPGGAEADAPRSCGWPCVELDAPDDQLVRLGLA